MNQKIFIIAGGSDKMSDFVLMTDNNADLPESYYKEYKIGVVYASYEMDEKVYRHGGFLPEKEFYDKMRKGAMPTTAQINPVDAREAMEPYVKEGKDILLLAFASTLSGTCNALRLAGEELKEEYPERTITVIDTLCASIGQGLLVHEARKLRDEGKSMTEIAKYVEEHRGNVVHVFTVDDLNHLYRGGRVSKTTAILGGALKIKPLLVLDEEGKLVPAEKARGRKKAIMALVEYMNAHIGSYKESCDTVAISHGDASQEDIEYLVGKIKEEYKIETILINTIGATIGAHSGPGALALTFMGEKR